MFNIVDKSNNYVFETYLSPHSPWEGLQVVKFTHFSHKVFVTGTYIDFIMELYLDGRRGEWVKWDDCLKGFFKNLFC